MHPFSYTGIKIIHDEKIREALEHQRLYAGQEKQRQGLFRAFGKFLARFNKQPARKIEEHSTQKPLVKDKVKEISYEYEYEAEHDKTLSETSSWSIRSSRR